MQSKRWVFTLNNYRAIATTALRYGTFWPGALAYDAYNMYKKRRRTDKGGNLYRKRKFLQRPRPYRPVMRKRLNTSKKASNKWSRWKRTIRSIPSTRVKPFRFFRYPLGNSTFQGAQLSTGCLTDIPIASRSLNNIFVKSFDINLSATIDLCYNKQMIKITHPEEARLHHPPVSSIFVFTFRTL